MDETPDLPDSSDTRSPDQPPPPESPVPESWQPPRRRWGLPLALFVITCLSTLWAGAAGFGAAALFDPQDWSRVELNWSEGLHYMLAVMTILLAHEMGHFLLTLRHRIPASWPFFIPMPISFIGTMGAVIGMQAFRANRKQLFDIGIAGPMAGLVIAIPITIAGIRQANVVEAPARPAAESAAGDEQPRGLMVLDDPLLVELMIRWLRPDAPQGDLNPLLLAGWVGFLITGLNMMPISQLDGGHISYALLGKGAHTLARIVVLAAVVFMVSAGVYQWSIMLLLVVFIGIKHPPTADDQVALGPARKVLGWTSFLIPILCFPPLGISII